MNESDYKWLVIGKPKWRKGNKFEENYYAPTNSQIISSENNCCFSNCVLRLKISENGDDRVSVGCDRHKLIMVLDDSEIHPSFNQKNLFEYRSITNSVLDSNISYPPLTNNEEKVLNLTKSCLRSLGIEKDISEESSNPLSGNINQQLNSLDPPTASVCGCENLGKQRQDFQQDNHSANAKNTTDSGYFGNNDDIIFTNFTDAICLEVAPNESVVESNFTRKSKSVSTSEHRYDSSTYNDTRKMINVADNTSCENARIRLDKTYVLTDNGNTSVRKNNEGDFPKWINKSDDIFERDDSIVVDLLKCNNKADRTCERNDNASDPFERVNKATRNLEQTNKARFTFGRNVNEVTTSNNNWFDKADNISEWFDKPDDATKNTEMSVILTSGEISEILKKKMEEKPIREKEATRSTEIVSKKDFLKVSKMDPKNGESSRCEEFLPKADSTKANDLTIFYKLRKNYFVQTLGFNNRIYSYQIDKTGNRKSCDIRLYGFSLRCTVHNGLLYTIGYQFKNRSVQFKSFNKETAQWRNLTINEVFKDEAKETFGCKMQITTLKDSVVIFLNSLESWLPKNYLWTYYPSYGLINTPICLQYQQLFAGTSCMISDLTNTVYLLGNVNYQWDMRTKQVTSLPIPLKFRTKPAACFHEQNLYTCGGRANRRKKLNTVEIFDLRANKWRNASPMKFKRKSHTLVPFEGSIWCLGGTKSDVIEIYNPVEDKWTIGPLGNPAQTVTACVF